MLSPDPQTVPFRQVLPSGRLHEPSVPEADVRTAMLIHVFLALGCFTGVLLLVTPVLWLTNKDRSSFIDDHGREACNFGLSMLLWTSLLILSVIGIPFAFMTTVLMVFLAIRSAIFATRREYVRYPLTIRIL